jgi:hypothetical protein
MVGTWLRPDGSFLSVLTVGTYLAHPFYLLNFDRSGEVHLRTLNYVNDSGCAQTIRAEKICGTLEMRSTVTDVACHPTFHSHNERLAVCLSTFASRPEILPGSTPLFQRVNRLVIRFENRPYASLLNKVLKLGEQHWLLFFST